MKMNSRLAACLAVFLLAFLCLANISIAAPQPVPFSVRGYVHDEDGAPAINADITIKNSRTGQTVVTNTSAIGYYKAILGGAPGSPYMVDDGDQVTVATEKDGLEGKESGTLNVNAAVAGTGPAFTWINVTLEEKVEPSTNWMLLGCAGTLGAAAVILVALALRKKRSDEEPE
jgi:hypothetical protein